MELMAPAQVVVAAGGLNPLDFDPSAFILTLIVFLIVLAGLMKFAWNPILDALDAREKRIDDAVTSAQNARLEAERVLADYKKNLADAERQVAQRIEEGRQMAARQAQEILDKAREETHAERDRAKRDIDLEKQRALSELRAETVRLSRRIAETVLTREVNEQDHRRMADEVLAALK
jgi:F-type H+-transporting ATPase subunit b